MPELHFIKIDGGIYFDSFSLLYQILQFFPLEPLEVARVFVLPCLFQEYYLIPENFLLVLKDRAPTNVCERSGVDWIMIYAFNAFDDERNTGPMDRGNPRKQGCISSCEKMEPRESQTRVSNKDNPW